MKRLSILSILLLCGVPAAQASDLRIASSDWTLGCIALENADMKTLFDLIEVGTPVDIAP